jgi:hypothetical protein
MQGRYHTHPVRKHHDEYHLDREVMGMLKQAQVFQQQRRRERHPRPNEHRTRQDFALHDIQVRGEIMGLIMIRTD